MNKFFYLLPILYILIVLILIGDYIAKSHKLNYQWGNIEIQITPKDRHIREKLILEKGLFDNVPIKHINIDLPQLSLHFYSNVNISKTSTNTTLVSISPLPSGEGFLLEFGNDIYISFQTSVLNPEEVGIFVHAKKDDIMHIPFTSKFGTKTTLEENSLLLYSPKNTLKGIASHSSYFLLKKKSFTFVAQSSYSSLRFSKVIDDEIQIIDKIPQIAPNVLIENQNLLSDYLQKAFVSWTTYRFDSSLGLWLQPEGFWGFSEHTLITTYAEAIRNSHLRKFKLSLDKATALNENYLTWETAFFSQKAPDIFMHFFDDVSTTQNFVSNEMTRNNRELLYDLNIWNTLPFWNNSTIRMSFLKFIQRNDTINISPENTAMLLYQSTRLVWEDFSTYIESNKKAFEDNLINNTVVINDGYMLINSNKNVDVLASIIGGKYLSQYGSTEPIRLLGARIFKTSLSLADEDGILPRTLVNKKNNLVSLGFITPEEIYPFIVDNKYYPSIKTTNIPSIYSYSASPVSLSQNNNIMEIYVDSKIRESTQYIYIWPIERPKSIFAFNLYWKGTPLPSNMTKGVSYDIEHKLLIIKMLYWNNNESITLAF